MTQRAQELLDKTMELSLRPQKGDRQKLIVFILREVVEQLQYYNVYPGEDMIIDARAVYELCDEVEAL
jgi:hypothetical protein